MSEHKKAQFFDDLMEAYNCTYDLNDLKELFEYYEKRLEEGGDNE